MKEEKVRDFINALIDSKAFYQVITDYDLSKDQKETLIQKCIEGYKYLLETEGDS